MANFWDNDEVVTDAAPSKVNFWDFDEIVELLDVATTPDTSPVSEDPDREFFQSGVGMEDRIFEPELDAADVATDLQVMQPPVADTVSRPLTSQERTSLSDRGSEITSSQMSPIVDSTGSFDNTELQSSISDSIRNPIKQALLKGSVEVETGGLGPVSENYYPYRQAALSSAWKRRMDADGLGPNASGVEIFNSVYANRNGNGNYASGDGNNFRGRGLIQITGRNTYQGVQDILEEQGVDINIITNPDLVNDPKYALPVAIAFLEFAGLDDASAETMTTKKLNNKINSGAGRDIAEDRWEEVVDVLRAAGMTTKANEFELRNEYAAQQRAGTPVDGSIGPNSRTAMRNYLANQNVPVPQGITDDELVVLVNKN